MKRLFAILAAAVCALTLTAPAFADATRAAEDDFFKAHRSECRVEERNYYVNSRDGCADLQVSPVNEKTVARAKNGAEVTVEFTYESNGVKWGAASYSASGDKKNWVRWDRDSGFGWIKMSSLLLVYDEQSFEKDHAEEFTSYDGSFDKVCASAGQRVILWSYPGSGAIAGDLKTLDSSSGALKPSAVWMDANGRVWGRIEDYKGVRGWACLSDPADESLPVTEHTYAFYPTATGAAAEKSQTETADAAETGDSSTALAVAGVCGITAVLLFSLRKKRAA